MLLILPNNGKKRWRRWQTTTMNCISIPSWMQVCGNRRRAHPRAPLRYYVWLPLLRIADMWLRPRTETLPSDSRWWEFNDDPKWSALAVGLGVIGLLYVGQPWWDWCGERR